MRSVEGRIEALEQRQREKQEGQPGQAGQGGQLIRLTGLWTQESQAGESYLSGSLSPSSRLLILPNTHKRQEHDPDYVAYLAPPLEKKEEPAARQAGLL